MQYRNISMSVLAAAVLVLAACSQPVPPADNVSASAPAATATPEPPATKVEAGVTFSVEPGSVHACPGQDRATSTVTWDVQRPEVKQVKVLISDATTPGKKTLAMMAPQGEAKTGNWVVAGMTIELVNAEDGAMQARHTVKE